MKKILKGFTMVLVLICTAMSFAGCMKIDWVSAGDKLINKGFDVHSETDIDDIEWYLEDCLINGDSIVVAPEDVNRLLIAEKRGDTAILFVVFCKNEDAAKRVEERCEEIRTTFAYEFYMSAGDVKCGRDGKVAYIGHKDAVKAAK